MEALVFWLAAAALVLFTLLTISSRSPVYSACWMILSFAATAGLFVLGWTAPMAVDGLLESLMLAMVVEFVLILVGPVTHGLGMSERSNWAAILARPLTMVTPSAARSRCLAAMPPAKPVSRTSRPTTR